MLLPVSCATAARRYVPHITQANSFHPLTHHIPDGKKKWTMIEKLGPMEPVGKVFVQRAGLSLEQAASIVERFAIHSHIPEPIRIAHLIAGAIVKGQSRGKV